MDWKSLGTTIAGFAPALGTIIGGPIGAAAGGLVAAAFGVENEPDAIAEAIKMDPEAALKLQAIQNKHIEELRRLDNEASQIDLDVDKAFLGDRADARDRDKAFIVAGKENHRATIMLTVAFAAFCFISYLIYNDATIKPGVLAIFNMSIGALLKMLSDGFAFEFGSSRGSKEKDALLKK